VITGWLIAFIVLVLGGFLAFVLWVARLLRHVYVVNAVSHAGCVQQVGQAVSKQHDAALLRRMAEKYDSVENQTVLSRMRWERSNENDHRVTIPAQWLREEADMIDPPPAETPMYDMSGQRVM
jgi:hypothetical protein